MLKIIILINSLIKIITFIKIIESHDFNKKIEKYTLKTLKKLKNITIIYTLNGQKHS